MTGQLDMVAIAVLAALAGAGAGYLHFRALRGLADQLALGRVWGAALQAARFAGLALFLYGCARLGPLALIAAAAGLLAGRALVMRQVRRETP